MKKTFSSKKSAFSLIELSIVLIIIGLLIAGVTGGASLIKSSELRSAMGEARGYAVAVNAFYSQYNALPGDYNTSISSSDAVGDGNSKIEYVNASAVVEGTEAWRDLNTIGAISVAMTYPANTTAAFSIATTNSGSLPASKIKTAGWVFDYNTTSSQNVVVLTAGTALGGTTANSAVNGTTVAAAALLATDALAIDSKIDDGSPTAGKVRGVNIGSATTCVNSTYQTSQTSKTCALSYQVDVNS